MDNSGRLGETTRDWGDYKDQKDQGIQMDNSRRLGKTARDWGDYMQRPWRPGYSGSKGGRQQETGGYRDWGDEQANSTH